VGRSELKMPGHRKDRTARLTQRNSGAWGTTSQNLLMVTSRLFHLSAADTSSALDKNYSSYVYAGLPLLLSAIQSFIIEYEGMLNLHPLPEMLSAPNGLALLLESKYGISGDLLDDFRILSEIRNEIIHPIPLPAGTPDNWPDYLRRVKQKGLLSSTGNPLADYLMFSQMASHALFKWAVETTEKVYSVIVNSDTAKTPMFHCYVEANFQTLFWT
jgi:hypothetical protein